MDYYKIGQRVRHIRRAQGLSQEELAEKVDISTTHMSHIETGNTKLSLPVLVGLAEALEVHCDDLLCDEATIRTGDIVQQVSALLEGCSAQQARVLLDVVKATKKSLDQYYT